MTTGSHTVFVIFLFLVGCTALLALSIHGWGYYTTSLEDRPFTPEYSTFKPSGDYGHGLGILGSLLIIIGVAMYSGRKRIRALTNAGRLSRWLEVHIFLCLVGPIFIIYHTTFKIGGVAAITFWTMSSVVLSGFIGRFFYTQIPKNLKGVQMTADELAVEIAGVGTTLQSNPVGAALTTMLDESFGTIAPPRSFGEILPALFRLEKIKRRTREKIRAIVAESDLPADVGVQLRSAASARASLLQQSAMLGQIERFLFYWHAIHLPFTIIMFVTLAMHVIVVLLLGYRWLF